jgi:methylmalonyl-CoA/ethylmalonyl-CoA epimerase
MSTTRFDHIAIALPRMIDAVPILAGVLGGAPVFGAESRVYRFGHWRFQGGGRIEVLEPTDDDGFLARFVAKHGPGIHHVTFKVASLDEACARARARGYDIVGHNAADPQWKEAFLHPRQALGIVVQLAESAPEPPPSPSRPRHRWQPPATVADPPPPVTVLGLRMTARARDRALAQWRDVLGGAPDDAAATPLVFRWPQSPLHLAVEIDPARDEGALAIEYAAARPVALTPEAEATLGVRFTARR